MRWESPLSKRRQRTCSFGKSSLKMEVPVTNWIFFRLPIKKKKTRVAGSSCWVYTRRVAHRITKYYWEGFKATGCHKWHQNTSRKERNLLVDLDDEAVFDSWSNLWFRSCSQLYLRCLKSASCTDPLQWPWLVCTELARGPSCVLVYDDLCPQPEPPLPPP